MNFRRLRYFVKVADKGGFTRAAEALGISQPALGLQIQKLEAEIGLQLLTRHARGVSPTPAGLLLLEHARDILQRVESAREAFSEFNADSSDSVSVGAPPNSYLSVEIARRSRVSMPHVSINISEGSMQQLFAMVANDVVEMACVYQIPASNDFEYEFLINENTCLIGKRGSPSDSVEPIEFSEVCRLPLILPSRASGLRRFLEKTATNQRLSLSVMLETDSSPLALRLIESGLGYTVRQRSWASPMIEKGVMSACAITNPTLTMPLGLIYRRERPFTKAGEKVLTLIREIVAEEKLKALT